MLNDDVFADDEIGDAVRLICSAHLFYMLLGYKRCLTTIPIGIYHLMMHNNNNKANNCLGFISHLEIQLP